MSSASSPTEEVGLPTEIFLRIFSYLHRDVDALLSCCLVNYFFRRIAQQVLVSCLTLSCRGKLLSSLKVFPVLESQPSLANYLHCLTLDGYALRSKSFPPVMMGLENLRSLHLYGTIYHQEAMLHLPWRSLSSASCMWLRSVLPRITTLKLTDWDSVTATFILACPNLRELDLTRVSFTDDTDDREDPSMVVASPLTLDSLSLIDVHWSPLLLRIFEDPQVSVISLSAEILPSILSNLPRPLSEGFFQAICSRNRDILRHIAFQGSMMVVYRNPALFPSAFSKLDSYRIPITLGLHWGQTFTSQFCNDLKQISWPFRLFFDADPPETSLWSFTRQNWASDHTFASWRPLDEGLHAVIDHGPVSIIFTMHDSSEPIGAGKRGFDWEKFTRESLLPKTSASGRLRFEYRTGVKSCC